MRCHVASRGLRSEGGLAEIGGVRLFDRPTYSGRGIAAVLNGTAGNRAARLWTLDPPDAELAKVYVMMGAEDVAQVSMWSSLAR